MSIKSSQRSAKIVVYWGSNIVGRFDSDQAALDFMQPRRTHVFSVYKNRKQVYLDDLIAAAADTV